MKLTEKINNLLEAKYSVTIPYRGKTKSVEVTAKSDAEAFSIGAKEMGVDHKNPTLIKQAKIKKLEEKAPQMKKSSELADARQAVNQAIHAIQSGLDKNAHSFDTNKFKKALSRAKSALKELGESLDESIEDKLAELDKREAELDARAEKGGVIGSHEDNTIKRERKKIRMERKTLMKNSKE